MPLEEEKKKKGQCFTPEMQNSCLQSVNNETYFPDSWN